MYKNRIAGITLLLPVFLHDVLYNGYHGVPVVMSRIQTLGTTDWYTNFHPSGVPITE